MPQSKRRPQPRPQSRPQSRPQPSNPFQAKWAILSGTSRKPPASIKHPRQTRNTFADRRIAEEDPTLPESDRYLARLQRERTRRSKRNAIFNLDSNQHYSHQSLSSQPDTASTAHPVTTALRDDYDEPHHDDDPLDQLNLSDGDTSDDDLLTLKTPSSEQKQEQPDGLQTADRTHREIMAEVMLKSKMHKAKRQHEKMDTDNQTSRLDADLQNIMQLLAKSGNQLVPREPQDPPQHSAPTTRSLFDDQTPTHHPHMPLPNDIPEKNQGKSSASFEYDRVYNQLAGDKRAKPSDRLLTAEEKAQKEVQELNRLERLRADRMANADDVEDDTLLHNSAKKGRGKYPAPDKLRRRGGDDLDDGFELDSIADSDADGSESETEASEADEGVGAVENGQRAVVNEAKNTHDAAEGRHDFQVTPERLLFPADQEAKIDDSDIPFVFKTCPSSGIQLQALFESHTIPQRDIVLERICKCFAVSLDPSANKLKLEKLLVCLLERIETLSMVSSEFIGSAVKEIDMLLVHAHRLGNTKSDVASEWARNKLADLCQLLTASSGKDKESGLSQRWTVGSVLSLRAIGRLFPASDLRHPVSSPLVLLLAEAIEMERIHSLADLGLALFTAVVLVEQMSESGRYCGQLVRLLCNVVMSRYGTSGGELRSVTGAPSDAPEQLDALRTKPLSIRYLMKERLTDQETTHMMEGVVGCALRLLTTLSFDGKVGHLDLAFGGLPTERLEGSVCGPELTKILHDSRLKREPMAMYTKTKSKFAAKLVNPKFSAENGVFRKRPKTSYHMMQSGDISASVGRIRRALRKEERGYARDVRQRAAERNRQKSQEEASKREKREKRTRETMAFLEEQEATWKRAEKRQKKLSGKKW